MRLREIDDYSVWIVRVFEQCREVIAGGKQQLAFDCIVCDLPITLCLNLSADVDEMGNATDEHHRGHEHPDDDADGEIVSRDDHGDSDDHDGSFALGHPLERSESDRVPVE